MKINKIIAMALFVLMAISLTPFVVSADEFTFDTVYSETAPTLGGDKQEASNPEHDDEDKWIVNATNDKITLTYSGLDLLNITRVSYTLSSSVISQNEYSAELMDRSFPFNLSTNDKVTFKLTAKVPQDLDAVNANSEEVAFDIGDLKFELINKTETASGIVPIYMQRENNLIIDDFDALINNKDTESNIEDGDDIQDLKPGDQVELSILVKSNYVSRENIDIENVEIDIICTDDEDLNFDDDNVDVGDLGPKDDSDETISFDIEDDAVQNTASCDLTVTGVDENGAEHGHKIEGFGVEITRDSHDIVIKNVRVTPNTLSCDDGSLQVAVDMMNLGKRDEDEVGVQIQSIALGINEKISNLVIDEDDTSTETFIASINKNLVEEKYALLVSTFYDNNKQTDSVVIQIDNLCTEFVPVVDDDNNFVGSYTNVIGLSENSISAEIGKLVSVKVELTNTENSPVDYVVSLDDLGDFATSTSSKTVHLNPGQTSNVFLNMKTNDDAEEGATYTASVVLKDASTGSILETKTFTVDVEGKAEGTGFTFGNFGGSDSKVFLIVLNVVLVIIAIFLIKLIFGSGKKKTSKPKKMVDFEPKGSVIIKRKK